MCVYWALKRNKLFAYYIYFLYTSKAKSISMCGAVYEYQYKDIHLHQTY